MRRLISRRVPFYQNSGCSRARHLPWPAHPPTPQSEHHLAPAGLQRAAPHLACHEKCRITPALLGGPGGGDPVSGLGKLCGGTRWTCVRASSRLRLGPSSRPGTDLSNALRPPQDFGPGCARLSAPAWGSSWGWRRPDGGVGCEAESEGDPPASRARPTPPAFGLSGLCRPRRWGGSGRFLRRWGSESRSRRTPVPETNPGLHGTLFHLPGRERSGRRPALQFAVPRGSAPGLVAAEDPATRGEGERWGAFWWAPRTLRGREARAERRSFSPPPLPLQPFASEPWHLPRLPPIPVTLFPMRSEPPSRLDCRQGQATRASGRVGAETPCNPISRKIWVLRVR